MLGNSKISAKTLSLVGFLLSLAIIYTYGRAMTLVYGGIELGIAALCYWRYFNRYNSIDLRFRITSMVVIIIAWFAGLIHGDLKSTLLITTPLIMPLSISTLNISFNNKTDFALASVVAVVVTFMTITGGMLGRFNPNTVGFLGFMGASLGFVWIKSARLKIVPTIIVLYGIITAALSGSRNVAVVGLICIVLLFLPDWLFKRTVVYYFICSAVLLYTVFSADLIAWGFSQPRISIFLLDFTSKFSGKAWSMAARADYLYLVKDVISQRGFFTQLFGTGTLTGHGHNMFYQCVMEFGYVGTMLIYLMFARVFKLAHIIIVNNKDDIALGCTIALLGNFLLQGADVYMLGPEAYAVVPQILIGIILQRYSVYRRTKLLNRS